MRCLTYVVQETNKTISPESSIDHPKSKIDSDKDPYYYVVFNNEQVKHCDSYKDAAKASQDITNAKTRHFKTIQEAMDFYVQKDKEISQIKDIDRNPILPDDFDVSEITVNDTALFNDNSKQSPKTSSPKRSNPYSKPVSSRKSGSITKTVKINKSTKKTDDDNESHASANSKNNSDNEDNDVIEIKDNNKMAYRQMMMDKLDKNREEAEGHKIAVYWTYSEIHQKLIIVYDMTQPKNANNIQAGVKVRIKSNNKT